MQVRLLIHLERVPDGEPTFVWWAESPELPGFSAAADHLPELLRRAANAIPAVAAEDGLDTSALQILPVLAMQHDVTGSTEAAAEEAQGQSPTARSVVVTA